MLKREPKVPLAFRYSSGRSLRFASAFRASAAGLCPSAASLKAILFTSSISQRPPKRLIFSRSAISPIFQALTERNRATSDV
jgi:hypothetical protein